MRDDNQKKHQRNKYYEAMANGVNFFHRWAHLNKKLDRARRLLKLYWDYILQKLISKIIKNLNLKFGYIKLSIILYIRTKLYTGCAKKITESYYIGYEYFEFILK